MDGPEQELFQGVQSLSLFFLSAIFGLVYRPKDFASYMLGIFICNLLLYLAFYVIMKVKGQLRYVSRSCCKIFLHPLTSLQRQKEAKQSARVGPPQVLSCPSWADIYYCAPQPLLSSVFCCVWQQPKAVQQA